MSGIGEIRDGRVKKLEAIKRAGFLPYPAKVRRTHFIDEALSGFSKISRSKKEIILVGRIRSLRRHGNSLFLNVEDGTGLIQAYFKKNILGAKKYSFFLDNFDIGDFIEIKGLLFKTKKGEKTIEGAKYRMLTKSLLPLPEKWHGLKDEEERLRKRYLDILFNPEVKDMIQKKALFWSSMREFLIQKGFLEVETPVLETTTGGADAAPFKTHHKALDIDIYLRISMGELWQKKLMVAGFEKTFEIGRQFRNEGMSAEHLQDYTQMEFYWAYADYKEGMKLTEALYKYVLKKTFKTLKFKIRDFDLDFSKKWEKYDYSATIKENTGIDISKATVVEMEKKLDNLNVKYNKKGFNKVRATDTLWKYCRKSIAGPGFLINHPVDVSPLAKRNEKDTNTVARFQVIIAGSEMGNGYSELNDPIDQNERFIEQEQLRIGGDEEAQMFAHSFVEALEYGMPPTFGFGVSERLFSFLMNKPIRECQIFPLMKPKNIQNDKIQD